MSKNKKVEETRTSIDNLNDSLTSMSEKVQANRKLISGIVLTVTILVAAILVYVFLIRRPAAEKAATAVGVADRELLINGNDSTALAIYQQVAEDGYSAGNRAALQAAIILFNDGKYEEALASVSDYSAKDDVIGAAAYSLKGDCLVNLDRYDEAVKAFDQAISQSAKNPYYTPFFMMKKARVLRAQEKYADEAAVYEEILDQYPTYPRDYNVNVEKELSRARLRAGK